ncbi:hypothetical protein QA639_37315 [Bradyrhizobium pachyrhizi]|uniref:hypothetical protein n=1 Tax=Bradyrhizobium pachyrhizi TaxID=280333 RepID=UPI0024B21A00|nr:hypothetical protein [Bradyrhizobium pachyrhizi]WFU55152.1 hypothetical protein QA639_37315 [Bradyrhizobium pachyrhizi]
MRYKLTNRESSFAAYIVDRDGHIANRIDLLCIDEAAARESAKALANDNQIELWDGDRLIAEFKPMKWSRLNRYAIDPRRSKRLGQK